MSDYLWDPSGEADPEVEGFEEALSCLTVPREHARSAGAPGQGDPSALHLPASASGCGSCSSLYAFGIRAVVGLV